MSGVVYPPIPRVPLGQALERLFWRAGFGPSNEDRKRFKRLGLEAAIEHLLNPPRGGILSGPEPVIDDGGSVRALAPEREHGHDVLWWLDRMVRTRAPLVERMTLNLHDHFATSNQGVPSQALMIRQNELLRRHALGSFRSLARGMLHDFAMQWWQSLVFSHRDAPNENFARELMELFTLGSGYTESDVREAARALTGFEFDWQGGDYADPTRYRWNEEAWDPGVKRIFGQSGRFRPDDVIELCLKHPAHAAFLCRKLWGYFSPAEPPASTLRQLVAAYRSSGLRLKPVVRVILRSAAFYSNLDEPDLVKPPVVYLAGALRATRTFIRTDAWAWLLFQMGQAPFYPPNVGGWNQNEAFLSVSATKARFDAAAMLLWQHAFPDEDVPADESPEAALADALRFAGRPWMTEATRARLERFAREVAPSGNDDLHTAAERRRVLRHLLLAGPDAQVH